MVWKEIVKRCPICLLHQPIAKVERAEWWKWDPFNQSSQRLFERICFRVPVWLNVVFLFIWAEPGVGGCGGLTAGEVGTQAGCGVGSIEWIWSQRERGHFFGVSHCGERLGSLPAGLTALSRNVCDWRPGWGCALSCSLCKRQSGVICLVDCGVVFLLFTVTCAFISFTHWWWPRFTLLCLPMCVFMYVVSPKYCVQKVWLPSSYLFSMLTKIWPLQKTNQNI